MSGRREVRPSKRVCRSLFGRPDPEEVRRDLDLCLKSMQEEQCHKYNFDFENDLPLDSPDSRYRWEISEDSPAFYREKVYTTNSVELCAKTQTLTLEKNNNNNNIEDVPVESESDRSPGVKRNHQSHITEYFKQSKRRRSLNDKDTSSSSSGNHDALRQSNSSH